ncbi:MAG: CocE/NonD family hydrolase [Ignavibacteriales bacterium]
MKFIKQLLLLSLLIQSISFAQKNFIKENYVKHEYLIPMRDGVKLFTAVYSPKDKSEKYPILIWRTPYSCNPYGDTSFTNIPRHLAEEKFIFVYQDVRGKFMSEGEFVNMRPYIPNKTGKQIDESSDTYDTIDWLVKNIENNNGNVGIYGISYPGFYAAMSLNDSHPALKAVSPQAPISDWFVGDDMHHNGALTLLLSYNFFSVFGKPRPEPTKSWVRGYQYDSPDAYNFFLNIGPIKNLNENILNHEIPFWNEVSQHPNYDEFWQSRNTRQHFKNVKPAVMTVGGWFDGENLFGALQTYESVEEKNPNAFNILVMGPWRHGGWSRSDGSEMGDLKFGSNTSEYFKKNLELPFFNYFLKNKGQNNFAEATVFEVGKNTWHKLDNWPVRNADTLKFFMSSKNKLATTNTANGFNFYISDPFKPVPYTAKFQDSRNMYNRNFMVEDQRFASTRNDVLVFTTDEFTEDISVAGPIEAEIFASASSTDADFVVKIIDVFPDSSKDEKDIEWGGYQLLVRGDIMRGKYRESYVNPTPLVPNEVTKIKLRMNDIFHTFKKGHKLMVQIQSSWFPLFDRNPQKFCDIYNASESDFQRTTIRVYYSNKYPSNIKLLKMAN